MENIFIMSERELIRKAILDDVIANRLSIKDASIRLELSYRQTRRVLRRYVDFGPAGLCHQSRGKPPSNAIPLSYKRQVLDCYQSKYLGYGATYASEKLTEDDGFDIKTETLRRWLLSEGLINRVRKRKTYRRKRDRRPHFGELLQIDGSIHDWFNTGKNSCLLNMVDDATGITMAQLAAGETTHILLTTLKLWIESYGLPKAVYVDLKSVYVSPASHRKEHISEESKNFCVFERVCKKLGIDIIKAYSAQAKGRVERKHRVFQDRFVKDLKLYSIDTESAANQYLLDVFLPKINDKFSYHHPEMQDVHRDVANYGDIDEILCWEYERSLKHNWTFQLFNTHYQLEKSSEKHAQPNDKLLIRKYLNGQMKVLINGQPLEYTKLDQKKANYSEDKKYYKTKGRNPFLDSKNAKKNKSKSPWATYNPDWLKKHSSAKHKTEKALSKHQKEDISDVE